MRLTRIALLITVCHYATPLSWAQIVPMTNNACNSGITLDPGVNPGAPAGLSGHVFTNVGATSGGPLPAFCDEVLLDVWFYYQSSVSGPTTISTCTPVGFAPGSLVDTFVGVHAAGGCSSPSLASCNDDACGSLSSVTFTASAGQFYIIRIGGMGSSSGTFYVVVTPPPPPPNDDCPGAIALSIGQNGPFSNATATNGNSSVVVPCVSPATILGSRDLWFSLTACGALTIDTCNGPASFDTVLQVYDVCGGVELACNDDTGSGCGFGSTVTLTPSIQTNYVIRVSAYVSNDIGSFPINVTQTSTPTASVAWSAPSGPGSIKADLSGPQNGAYFLALTIGAGVFPNGWLFGLDISYAELAAEIGAGFPFTGPLGACGHFALGPFQGLPSGFTVYSIAFGFLPGVAVPSSHSAAVAFTVP